MTSFPDNAALLRHSHDSALRFQNPTGYRPVATPPWLVSSPMSGRGPQPLSRDRRVPLAATDAAPSRRLPSRSRTQQPAVARSCVVGDRHRTGGTGLAIGVASDEPDAITSPPFSEPKVSAGTEPLDEIEQRTSATMKGLRHMYDLLLAPCWGEQSRTPPAILRVVDELRTECERITKNHMKTFETVISAKMVVASAAGYGDDSGGGSGGDDSRAHSPPRQDPSRWGNAWGSPSGGGGDDGVPRPVAVVGGDAGMCVSGETGGLWDPESGRETDAKTPSWLHGEGALGSSPKSTPAQSARPDHVSSKESARPRREAPPSLSPELIGAATAVADGRAATRAPAYAHSGSQEIAEEFVDDDNDDDVDSVELSSMSSDHDDPVPSPAVFVRRSVMTPRSRLRRSKQRQ